MSSITSGLGFCFGELILRPSRFRSSTYPRRLTLTDRCTLDSGLQGHCVHSYLCIGGRIATDGGDLTDERTLQCNPPQVCCQLSEEIKETTTTPRSSTLVNGIPTPPSGPGTKCQAADNSTGRCLYPHLCTDDTTVIDGDDLVDERTIDPCPSWKGAIQICCPAKYLEGKIDIFTESPPVTPPVTVPDAESRDGRKDEVVACTTRHSGLGSCVPLYQCVSDDEDGANVINIRFDSNSPCSFAKVCCPVENVDRNLKPVTPPPATQCGTANPNGLVYKNISGNFNEAKYGEFPWMVAVRSRTGSGPDSYNISGGSIIHPWVVLTAAHYVVRAQANGYDVRVRAGEWNLQSTDEPFLHQEQAVHRIKAHAEFNSRNKRNDIALLFLKAPFQLAPHVGVVCLPPPSRRAQPSTDCVATGWGKDKFGPGGKGHSIMKKTILPVMAREECQIRLRNTRLGPFYQLHSGFMCAGGERLDTCTQDGGGPLACPLENEPNRYVVAGIVSWGIGCGQDGVPGVYMEVAQYTTWIRTEVVAEGYDLDNFAY